MINDFSLVFARLRKAKNKETDTCEMRFNFNANYRISCLFRLEMYETLYTPPMNEAKRPFQNESFDVGQQ